MSTPAVLPEDNHAERRRSPRQLRDVPLLIRGDSSLEQQPFQEETFTISISDYGALVLLAARVVLGQRLLLVNLSTQNKMEGWVARLGPPYGGLAQVGIEFAQPAPEFWPAQSLQ